MVSIETRMGPSSNLHAPEIVPMSKEDQSGRYPLYEVLDTQEQAMAAAAIRNRGKDVPVPPIPSA
jgi:hypothetical protein